VGSVGEELRIRAPAPLGEHRARGPLGLARRAELAAFEAVEQALEEKKRKPRASRVMMPAARSWISMM